MAANPTPAPENPCCAALRKRCSKLEEKRTALREGCSILKSELSKAEAENLDLKKANEEEHARTDHERSLREKEFDLRKSMESKVAELESQLSCVKEAESTQLQRMEKELMVLQEKVSEKEAEIDRLKERLMDESGRVSIEQGIAAMERQKVLELSEALEAEKKMGAELISCNHVETETVDGSETDNAIVLQYKKLAEENVRKLTDERSCANNLMKQLEEQTLQVDLLQKELLALRSFRESADAEACFAKQLSEKEAELNQLINDLGEVKSGIDAEQKKAATLEENFVLRLSQKEAELNQVKDLLKTEKSRADAEQKKADTLKESFELEKRNYLESYNLAQAECNRLKDSLAEMDGLKKDVSKLTLELSKYEDLTKKFDAERNKALRERQRADAEVVKALELQRLAKENETKLAEERSNSKCLLQQVEEERGKVEMLQIQLQELSSSCKRAADEHSDFLNLKIDYSKLEAENKMLIRDRECFENVKAIEMRKIAEESEKKFMEERSNSERLSQILEEERGKVETLQRQVHELLLSIKTIKSIANGSDSMKLKEVYSKHESGNRVLTGETKQVDSEMARVDGLTKDSKLNGRNCLEENCSTNLPSLDLESCRQRIKEWEELQGLRLSRRSAEDYTAPDVSMNTLIHEQLKLEKKRLKHAKQVAKLEKDRNNLLQCELRKFKQDFVQMAQSLGLLEEAFSGGTQALDESTKSSEMLKLQSLNLKKTPFCSNLRGKNEQELVMPSSSTRCGLGTLVLSKEHCQRENSMEMPSGTNVNPLLEGPFQEVSPNSALNSSATSYSDKSLLGPQEELAGSLASTTIAVDGNPNPQAKISKPFREAGKRNYEERVASMVDNCSEQPLEGVCARSPERRKPLGVLESLICVQSETRKSHQKLEENASKVNSNIRTGDQLEGRLDGPHKKRKLIENSKATLEHPAALPAPRTSGSSEPRVDHTSVPESLICAQSETRKSHQKLEENASKLNSNSRTGDQLEGRLDGPHKKRKLIENSEATLEHPAALPAPRASGSSEPHIDHTSVPESLICVQSETRKSHQKLEEDASKVNGNLRTGDQLEARLNGPHKKRKLIENSKATPEHPAALPAPRASGSSEPHIDHMIVPESLPLFENQLDGDFMKLLDLDDEAVEELFRTAIESPLSPTLPEVDWESGGLAGLDILNCGLNDHRSSASDLGKYDHFESAGQEEHGCPTAVVSKLVSDGIVRSKPLVSVSDCAKQTDNSQLGVTVENMPHLFILFAAMEDITRMTMVVLAIRRCIEQCSRNSQAGWVLMDLLTALASEEQLTPREKVCALFTLGVHDYLRVSLNNSELCFDEGSSSSFSSYICSALSDPEKRGIFAKSFDFSELLCLYEDFVAERRILCRDENLDLISDFSLGFDIPLEDKKVALYGKTASTREVVAGSVIISSICLAVDRIGVLCDVSFNILRLLPVVPQLILHILHCFACLCGEKYFSVNNCSMRMEVVKCMMSVLESTHEDRSATLSSGCQTCQPDHTCDRSPLLGSSQPLDLLSLLSEELQKFASMPLVRVGKDQFRRYFDVMSSLELISTIMGWSWTVERVLPELQKILESCIEGNFSAPLVLLLGRIGGAGAISHGYEDAGVGSIRQYLSSLPIKISGLNRKRALATAIAFAVRVISSHNKKHGVLITRISAFSTPAAKALLASAH